MDLKTVVVSILILPTPFAVMADTGRSLAHQQRLDQLDLSTRVLEVSERQNSVFALAAGDDLRVSGSVAPARFDQNRAQTIQTETGNWWVVWEDDRMGSRKIYRQIYDTAGVAIGANEIIAGSDIGARFTDPRLAIDTAGQVHFAYRDQTAGMIYAGRYLADGTQLGATLLVNDTTLNSFAGPFDMTVFPDGQMAVAWENYSALGSTIEMRVYTPAGASLAGPITVNNDGGSVNHWVPAVAHAPGSGFLVVWEDYRNGRADIYAQQFTGDGTMVGSDFGITPSPDNTAGQYSPRVVYSSLDKYVIGWVDSRSGWEIYLQRYDQTVGLVGDNMLISSGHSLVTNRDLTMAVASTGGLNLLWSASGADNTIQSLELDSGLVPAGLPGVVNLSDLGQRWAPSVAYGTGDSYATAWTEMMDDDPDIALMLFAADGNRTLGDEVTVNDDAVGAHSVDPQIIATNNWRNLVAYSDGRYDQGDIFIRALSNAGTTVSSERRMNQDAGSALQSEPTLAVSDTRVLVVWNDARTLAGFSGQRIYGRFASYAGDPDDNEFIISDPGALAVKGSPCAAMQPDGTGLVVWLDRRDGTAQVYGQHLAADGSLDGSEFLISAPGTDLAINSLALGRHSGDRFSVIWHDASAGTPSVTVKQFDTTGALLSTVTYSPGMVITVDELAADVADDGTVALFWIGIDGGQRHAYLTRIAGDGSILTESFQITDSPDAAPSDPSISVSNNAYFSLGWIDRRDGRELAYYQILDSDIAPLSADQPVSSIVPEYMEAVHTDAYRGRAWFVWSDPREEGLNVYAQPLVYLPTGVDDDDPETLPLGYVLSQNYPNPFNPSTEIAFTIPTATHARLTVINSLGQTVTTLVDDIRSAGSHRVIWDGRDSTGDRVASGVYMYRLTTDTFTHTRKMLLLK